jgi:hypothetical protein
MNAASQLEGLSRGYSLYAYSQWFHALTRDGASMCSGSVLEAWDRAEGVGSGFNVFWYTPAFRASKALPLYQHIFNKAFNATLTQTSNGDAALAAAQGIGRQIVNAFAYGRFRDFSVNWSEGAVGWGLTASPDDLHRSVQAGYTAYSAVEHPITPVPGSNVCRVETVWVTCSCSSPGAE